MYALKVLKGFTTEDGRLFMEGHDVKSLSAFEVSELMTDYPDNFEPADNETVDFLKNTENVKHLADAVKRQRAEFEENVSKGIAGNLTAKKVKK